MNPSFRFALRSESADDPIPDAPDSAELTVLTALRTWLRPGCTAQPTRMNWEDVLHQAGLCGEGIEHFDLVMRALTTVTLRPLDARCRCATGLAGDEASLLQVIAFLQAQRGQTAINLLGDWLPAPAVSGLLKLIRWFAIDLLDAGLKIRARERAVHYLQ